MFNLNSDGGHKRWTALPLPEAASVYGCSPLLAAVLEASPGDPLRTAFRAHIRSLPSIPLYETGWGLPDIAAARTMYGISLDDFAAQMGVEPEEIAAAELCWLLPTLGTLLGVAHELGWPFGAFFRNADGEPHPLTWLSRVVFAGRRP